MPLEEQGFFFWGLFPPVLQLLIMSRTKRIYNKPNKIFGIWVRGGIGWQCYWHPYKELDVGKNKCFRSREERVLKWRRQEYHRQMLFEIKNL